MFFVEHENVNDQKLEFRINCPPVLVKSVKKSITEQTTNRNVQIKVFMFE